MPRATTIERAPRIEEPLEERAGRNARTFASDAEALSMTGGFSTVEAKLQHLNASPRCAYCLSWCQSDPGWILSTEGLTMCSSCQDAPKVKAFVPKEA